MRNFFRSLFLVVAVVLCLCFGVSAVYASAFEYILEPDSSSEVIDSGFEVKPSFDDIFKPAGGSEVIDSGLESDSDYILNSDSKTVKASGANVYMEFQNNDTLAVPSSVSNINAVSSYSLSDDGSIRNVIVSLFGVYAPRTQSVTVYYNGEAVAVEEQVVPGLAGIDYEWIASVALFALMLWCLFRFLGGLMKRG